MLRSLVVQKREQMYLIVTFANTQISNNTYSVNIKMLMLGFFFVLFLLPCNELEVEVLREVGEDNFEV